MYITKFQKKKSKKNQKCDLDHSFFQKKVLELGPGSDLGIGLYLIYLGCENYTAIDVNYLMKDTPNEFYDELLKKIKEKDQIIDIDSLKLQIRNLKDGKNSLLNYIVAKDFNIANVVESLSIDLVLSQAAFEHFNNIDETIKQLNEVCKPGAILLAEIDLRTHSRWIRKKDPNNIYRYPEWLYKLFAFKGAPNRIRPYKYVDTLFRNGWKEIIVTPLSKIQSQNLCLGMNKLFVEEKNQMEILSVVICAKKG